MSELSENYFTRTEISKIFGMSVSLLDSIINEIGIIEDIHFMKKDSIDANNNKTVTCEVIDLVKEFLMKKENKLWRDRIEMYQLRGRDE